LTEFAAGASLHDGRYRLERRLGSGGMAAVWLAHDATLDRPVAIKALSDLLADDEGYVRRFRREARVVAGLSHPNLVRVFDFGLDPRPYLVMEYVEGGTLADRLRAGDRDFDSEGLVRGLLDALDHVHGARIVHRDVKPSNVLVGADGRPRLTDFGIALPEDATQLTRTGGVMGTARFLAPEVLEGGAATPASDLYSLGMLVRECIETGEEPLGMLADRLTARDPVERPQSAAEALALLEDQTVPLPPTRPQRGGRREYEVHVSGRAAAIGVAVLAALVLVIALATGGGGDGEPPAAAPRNAPLSRQLDALERAVKAAP